MTDGRGVVYTLCPPKFGRGLNHSLVKGLIPHLEAVVSTYPRDLSPESFIGLYHPYIIAVLVSLISGLLGLLQLFLQGDNLLFGGGQLVLGLVKKHLLTFDLPFSAVQGSFSTFFVPLRHYQLTLELLITFFGHVEGFHGHYSPPFFFLHLPMAEICNLFCPKLGLNSLPRKETW